MYSKKIYFIGFMIAVLLTASCTVNNNYQKEVNIPEGKWFIKNQPEFTFNIEDTAVNYQPFILLRNDDAYGYNNIWFKILIKKPGEKSFTDSMQIEAKLSDEEGNPFGLQQGNIWFYRIALGNKKLQHFSQKGNYTIAIKQMMRDNPLTSVLNVGFALEKR